MTIQRRVHPAGSRPACAGCRVAVPAAESAFILVCVGFNKEVRELIEAEDGLLKSACPGTIIAVLSTVHPGTVKTLAEVARAKQVRVVDAIWINPGTDNAERLPTRYADYPLQAGDTFCLDTP
ncbi:MAG: hypothetical protein LBQ32_08935, partial [Burkholderiaceae bacterium]|nr:hypothetical protein [Burkholderiaceae bacterium]